MLGRDDASTCPAGKTLFRDDLGRKAMRTLRLRGATREGGHGGEVFSCVYTSDGSFVLSAGWDGYLRLWMAANATPVTSLHASHKPLSCCALTPDGSAWLSGSMDGVLSWWDAVSHQPRMNFIAHIRPISAIQFSPDGSYLATASWDRKLVLRRVGQENDGRSLNGHQDIVSGCRWSSDGKLLLSWSHDASLRLWDAETGREVARLPGHADRVSAACLSKAGQWVVSGGRDGAVKLWDLRQRVEVGSIQLRDELFGCWILPDDSSVLTVSVEGRLAWWSLPDFKLQTELAGNFRVMSGDLASSGTELVLGGEDGNLHFVAIEGVEEAPLLVTPTATVRKPKSGVLRRILGKPKTECSYHYTCPVCRHTTEISRLPDESIRCVTCNRLLKVHAEVAQLQVQS
jgi:WD40 repeat protein